MKLLSFFRREKSLAAERERQARVERAVTEGLRAFSGLLTRLADRIEKQRLSREGYQKPDAFLSRKNQD